MHSISLSVPSYFYPRPPRGGRPAPAVGQSWSLRKISIHALREEGDGVHHLFRHQTGGISIHALREEGDATMTLFLSTTMDFYPRPPRGGRRLVPIVMDEMCKFLSTPSARRATRV